MGGGSTPGGSKPRSCNKWTKRSNKNGGGPQPGSQGGGPPGHGGPNPPSPGNGGKPGSKPPPTPPSPPPPAGPPGAPSPRLGSGAGNAGSSGAGNPSAPPATKSSPNPLPASQTYVSRAVGMFLTGWPFSSRCAGGITRIASSELWSIALSSLS